MNSFNILRPVCLLSFLFTMVGCTSNDPNTQIATAIARDAAMSKADFDTLASSTYGPKLDDVRDKSLTLVVFSLRHPDAIDESMNSEFEFLKSITPKPSEIATEITRKGAPLTCIHSDRITNLEITIDGETAIGTVSFLVPELYRGRIGFVARYIDSQWRVIEFRMPAHGIQLSKTAEGVWALK